MIRSNWHLTIHPQAQAGNKMKLGPADLAHSEVPQDPSWVRTQDQPEFRVPSRSSAASLSASRWAGLRITRSRQE